MFVASIVQTITLNQVNTASPAQVHGKLTPLPQYFQRAYETG